MSGDYYQILGVSRQSNTDEIKRAYKILALKYHPDRNPGNHEAEENFKKINEAYQILSDPIRRSKYKHQLEYNEVIKSRRQPTHTEYSPSYTRPRQPAPRRRTTAYKIDKEYYKVQKILIFIFVALLASAYGLAVLKDYRIKWAEEDRIQANELLLDSAKVEFRNDNFGLAFSMIDRLIQNNITDFDYYIHRDSMIYQIKQVAMTSFQAENYDKAAEMFKIVREFEWREQSTTLEFLSTSYARAGKGSVASKLLREKVKQEPNNISLLFYTAYLHAEELNKPTEALPFLNSAKSLFKKNNTKMYGRAFEFIIKPKNIPEVYYKVYNLSGRINQMLGNYGEAYTDSNWAIFIRPNNIEPYHTRIDSGIFSGQSSRICRDLSTLASLGEEIDQSLVYKYCNN